MKTYEKMITFEITKAVKVNRFCIVRAKNKKEAIAKAMKLENWSDETTSTLIYQANFKPKDLDEEIEEEPYHLSHRKKKVDFKD